MKLKAATLIESLIAMVILVVIFGTATMIYTNVLGSDAQRKKLKAMSLADREKTEIMKSKRFADIETIDGEWTVRSVFEKQENSEQLYRCSILVMDENRKLILERNELMLLP